VYHFLIIGVAVVGFSLLLPDIGESDAQGSSVPDSNKKFAICDDFMQVNWISAERRIGTTRYELVKADGSRRSVEAVVHLDRYHPRIDYGVLTSESDSIAENAAEPAGDQDIHRESGEEDISEKDKAVFRSWELQTGERGGAVRFTDGVHSLLLPVNIWAYGESLSGRTENVCIVYPDRDLAWIVETRDAKAVHEEKELDDIFEKVARITPDWMGALSIGTFKRTAAIDVNRDGIDDYPEMGVFSYGNEYRLLTRMSRAETDLDNYGKLQFEGNGKICQQDPPDAFFLLADGKDVILNGTCNLTEITRKE
jgi:hypothetical protein